MAFNDEWSSFLEQQGARHGSPMNSGVANGQQVPRSRGNGGLRRRSWSCPAPPEEIMQMIDMQGESTLGQSPGWRGAFSPHYPGAAYNDGGPPGLKSGLWVEYKMAASPALEADSANASPVESDWDEAHRQTVVRRALSTSRRMSCGNYEYDELEAARMRIKQAAWEVVDAQQKIDIVQMTPAEFGEGGKKKGSFKRWLTATLPWRSVASRG